ncbi:MAG: hypothetical protein LBR83_04955 [Clostridiales bacterium]|jgi:methionine-rich copper-binding protein CopC|nr:hypothetical protein [Clostridiales bacterium]
MKRKSVVIGAVIAMVTIASVYFFTRPALLGNMAHNYTEQTTQNAKFSFAGEANERIKFSFKSKVESGNLDMVLYDSQGNIVYTLDKAKSLEAFYTLKASGTYALEAICNNFTGKYEVKVFEAN